VSTDVRLNHMSVQVRNLEASAKFYQEILRLPEIECGAQKDNIRWFGLGHGQSVHLIEGDFGNTFVKISTHFCISSADFDGTIRHLRTKGAKFCNLRKKRERNTYAPMEYVRSICRIPTATGLRSTRITD
jgi:lactoylglutathione lyase